MNATTTQTSNTKKPGTTMKLSNAPNTNGSGKDWENFGRLFLDTTGRRGTVYLEVTVEQLQASSPPRRRAG